MLLLFTAIFDCTGQNNTNNFTSTHSDSLQFQQIKEQLAGCWKTKNYQFRYQDDYGYEFKSRIHSSAPFFKVIRKEKEVYLQWIEVTGGESIQKILTITKNKVIVENENKLRVVYRKNKNCSSQLKGIK